jgi:hypothetical protein
MKAPFLLSGFAAIAMTCVSTLAAAQVPAQPSAQLPMAPEFAKFKPRPSNTLKVDYAVWNEILNNLVFLTGLSTRQIAPKPEALTGTKFVWEHTSPFRQEGNKIPFSMLKPEHIATLQEYKRDLETVSNTVDIAALPENEQLAYWLNLHNASIITLIAENYPVLEPSNLKLGTEKAPLHDAKVIAVAGHMMSLRDIREKIVYPNWKDPKVVYGFFLGDIGSPSIQGEAFTADNTERLLKMNAEEFVNSLRSFSRGGISKIYKDVAPFYFPDFEKDLRNHFQLFMWEDVLAELAKAGALKVNSYEIAIADMEGGHGAHVIPNVLIDGKPVRNSQSYAIAAYTNQIKTKSKVLLRQGKIKNGVVIVGDESEEEAAASEPDKPVEGAQDQL